jgi:uncharacterized protein YpmS
MIQFSDIGAKKGILRMSIKSKLIVTLIVLTIALSGLGCALVERAISATPASVRTEDTSAVITQISAAATSAATGGQIVLEFTEGQLTTIANQELQNQNEGSLQDLQIRLNDGMMQITGNATQDGLSLPLTINLKINVDSQGAPHSQIVSAKVGPFSLPQDMLDQTTSQLDQILQQQLDASADNLFVDSLSIDNGKITIVAHTK